MPASFYGQDTQLVAKKLLGCLLCRCSPGGAQAFRIVETEAYCGPDDKASHAHRGRTPRAEVMFGPAGHAYVYLIYGMHCMLNIVTEAEDYPAAVLIRAVEPLDSPWTLPTNGPARLAKSLQIDLSFNRLPIYTEIHGLWVAAGIAVPETEIACSPRIGVDYAAEYKDKPWRFYVRGNRFVSRVR